MEAETCNQGYRNDFGSGCSSLWAVTVLSHIAGQGKHAHLAPVQLCGAGDRASFLTP